MYHHGPKLVTIFQIAFSRVRSFKIIFVNHKLHTQKIIIKRFGFGGY